LAAVCVLFFVVATLMAGSTCCPMRAMAAPSAGVAEACEPKLNESADAATTANKVIFMCFLLDDSRESARRTHLRRQPPCEPVLSNFSLWLAVRFGCNRHR
jgi:hypothetical protein